MASNHLPSLQFIEPGHPALRPLIKLYYLHFEEDPDFHQQITYFPNFMTTLNLYQGSSVSFTEHTRTHTFAPQNGFLQLLVGKFDRSREMEMKGKVRKITIVFYPLGLNHFLSAPLSQYLQDHFSFFDGFGEAFARLLPELFSSPTPESVRDSLDTFLLSRMIPFPDHRLKAIIKQIFASDHPQRVKDLAAEQQISRKTLLRLFRKHLGYSVEEYLSIVRFRKTMVSYQSSIPKPRLSEVAYAGNYYDQPDFNRQFKGKTGLSPKELFAELKTLETGLFWKVTRP